MNTQVWIQGMGRSGTSWLQKIMDHHPAVFSLHEPESRIPGKPTAAQREPPCSKQEMRDFADRLFNSTDLRAVRKKPLLRKSYRSGWKHHLRVGLIHGATGIEYGLGKLGRQRHLGIPDMTDQAPALRVAKCVSSPYPFDEMVAANPHIRFVFIIRHPCAVVQSSMTGIEVGKMRRNYLPQRSLLDRYFSFEKGIHGVTEDDFSEAEIIAYRWAVYNAIAFAAGQANENVRLLKYEDLCADPPGVAKSLFDWIGLDWHANCDDFLAPVHHQNRDKQSYHSFNKNPIETAQKWKRDMPQHMQDVVLSIARQSLVAQCYPEMGVATN